MYNGFTLTSEEVCQCKMSIILCVCVCVIIIGVLLPKQKLTFPFTFKSRKPGAFSEMWLLKTGPVLCRGRQIVFILKGFAFQEDKNKAKRDDLEVLNYVQ